MIKKDVLEEYEVHYINSHRIVYKGKNKKPSLEFEIKWKGYDASENTWEPSSATEHAEDLVETYWDIKGGGESARRKVERILQGEQIEESDKESDESEVEFEVKEEEEDEEEVEEEPTQRKKRTTGPSSSPVTTTPSKRVKKATKQSDSERIVRKSKKAAIEQYFDEDSDESVSESEIEKNDYRATSNHWTTDVDKIMSIKLSEDGELYAIVRWRDGKIGLNKTSLIAQKNPQLLINYYEKKLSFEKR